MNKINRRTALGVFPAVGVAIVAPAAAEAADSPIMALFRQWEAIYNQSWDDGTSEDEADICFDRMAEVEMKLLALPVTDAKDLAAKLIVYTMYGDATLKENGTDGPLLVEAKALVGMEAGA